MSTHRGTSNGNASGPAYARRRRKAWLLETYRANQDMVYIWEKGADLEGPPTWISPGRSSSGLVRLQEGWGRVALAVPACRCYRCGELLTTDTMTVDRIVPGCDGGTYRRNNIRPACGSCNSETGGGQRSCKSKSKRTG